MEPAECSIFVLLFLCKNTCKILFLFQKTCVTTENGWLSSMKVFPTDRRFYKREDNWIKKRFWSICEISTDTHLNVSIVHQLWRWRLECGKVAQIREMSVQPQQCQYTGLKTDPASGGGHAYHFCLSFAACFNLNVLI